MFCRNAYFCQLRGKSLYLFKPEKKDAADAGNPIEVYEVLEVNPWSGRKYAFMMKCTEKSTG